MIKDARGFGLIQVLMVSGLLTVVAMGAAAVINNTLNTNRLTASQSENAVLTDALRTQVSRRASCLASFATPPVSFGQDVEVAINLGTTRVQAGADLPEYRLSVKSLALRGIQYFGSTNGGNQVYFATLTLQTQSRQSDAGRVFLFREVAVARMTFEVQNGNQVVSCYANDPTSNQAQQLAWMCDAMASIEGVGGVWSNGRCRVPDASGPRKCMQLGGTWTGSRCAITPNIFYVARVIGYGAAGNTYYGAICPNGSSVTGVACYAQNGPLPPINTALIGNGGYCWWESGNESTQFVVQASCSP